MDTEYRVLPRAPKPIGAKDVNIRKPSVSFWGPYFILAFLTWALAVIPLVGTGTVPESKSFQLFFLLEAMAAGLAYIIYLRRKDGADRRYEVAVRKEVDRLTFRRLLETEKEAEARTNRAIGLRRHFDAQFLSLSSCLAEAGRMLYSAAEEYNDGALAPFWDRIEEVTVVLAKYGSTLLRLQSTSIDYAGTLRNTVHDFPPLPDVTSAIPDPKPLLGEFNRLVRLAQRKYEFAAIWEQRRTREVLLEGPSTEKAATLGDTVRNLEQSVNDALISFKASLCESIEQVVTGGGRMSDAEHL